MKFFVKNHRDCSGVRTFALFSTYYGRALFGIYWGYISIFWRNFETDMQIINTSYLQGALFNCDIDELTYAKFQTFMEEPLSFWQKLKYSKSYKFVKNREIYFKEYTGQLKKKTNYV